MASRLKQIDCGRESFCATAGGWALGEGLGGWGFEHFVPSGKIDGTGEKMTESILWVRGLDGCRWGADGLRMRRL